MEKDMSFLESDWVSLIYAALGAALGYWLRNPRGMVLPTRPPVPAEPAPHVAPELVEALRLLLERHCQKQTHALLHDLLREPEKQP
jgi:hypothetical protein